MADPAPACPICHDSGLAGRLLENSDDAGAFSIITFCGCQAGHRLKLQLAPITGPQQRNPKPDGDADG